MRTHEPKFIAYDFQTSYNMNSQTLDQLQQELKNPHAKEK